MAFAIKRRSLPPPSLISIHFWPHFLSFAIELNLGNQSKKFLLGIFPRPADPLHSPPQYI